METRRCNRFRGLGLLVLFLALVTPCWPLALTTFGKSNPQNNNNQNNENKQPGERIQARECASDSECAGIKDASCLESIFTKDKKLRCLCGDYREPRNGLCDNQYKGVKVLCNSNDECTTGAQCMVGNDTSLMGKRCWCMQGYDVDEDMQCSGSSVAVGLSALSLVASLLVAANV
ncbi:PREDICTED: uncharacterized protein LOC105368362 [Ceratosolen solmsi marchali]|uniref:Uncharacterized protein LOC105368362 n=1 Tax=Ceratosolen solmsi marchali TaxID=326594 RepID=A0AAJ6YWJ1_9HYME|nr:PREDICTED: uncharacterized protein LOC105368362 [Ceratosolen solmsi marchali]